jgi:hypothetical protein
VSGIEQCTHEVPLVSASSFYDDQTRAQSFQFDQQLFEIGVVGVQGQATRVWMELDIPSVFGDINADKSGPGDR